MEEALTGKKRVAGRRQVLRAIARGEARRVYVADDAAPSILKELTEAARAASVPVVTVQTMDTLGRACRLQVGTAAAAVIED